MSLTYNQIESTLAAGLSFHAKQREYVARADLLNDVVVVTEMSGLERLSIPIETIVDAARATSGGSTLQGVAELKALLTTMVG